MRIEHYLEEREELVRAAVPGTISARRLAALTDQLLAAMAEEAAEHLPAKTRWSLVALGGYGVGALLPGSDLDVLIVSNSSPSTLKPFVETLLYPLWDSGLDVGHQVRSRKEQLRAVREDTATLTATLTGRVIAGDRPLGTGVIASCAADARKRSKAVLASLHERQRAGSPYLLEPDLKEGAGGRRDYDELTWTAATITGKAQSEPSALISEGLLSDSEFAILSTAADTIAAARWRMQRAGFDSHMTEDATEEVTDPTAVQKAVADTNHLLLRVRDRLLGQVSVDALPLSASELFDLLDQGPASLHALEDAAWSGRLDTLIPGFRDLMVLRRPGLTHTLTVGAHCLLSATLISEISSGAIGDELAIRSARSIPDLRLVQTAAIIHDLGKDTPGAGHAERSAVAAESTLPLLGMDRSTEQVVALIRHHLLLAEVASTRDLDEEDVVLQTASVLGDRDLLAPLHVLTVADSLATGPGAWTDWQAALIGKLVVHLDAALADDVAGSGIAESAELLRSAALAQLTDQDPRRAFIEDAPIRYLTGRTAEEVLRHSSLAAELERDPTPGAAKVDITVGPLPRSFKVTIVTADRPGLLAKIAGVMALSGLDILGVRAVSLPSRTVLDTFTVHSATLADVRPETWSQLERYLHAALRDRLAVGVRLAERSRHYRTAPSRQTTDVAVRQSDTDAAILTVRAPDRVGLLHDIALAISESGLDIRSVTALTRSGIAEDTFRVVDADGNVPGDTGAIGQLKMRLRELG